MTVIYTTPWGDKMPCRDNLNDGCELDYSPTPTFDIGQQIELETKKYLRQRQRQLDAESAGLLDNQ